MSNLRRKMQRAAGDATAYRGRGKNVGLINPDCKCCAAKALREARREAKNKKGHVL